MARNEREYKLGRIARLREDRETMRVEIDAIVKALIYHFDPMDVDCTYVDKIQPAKVKIYANDIERKMTYYEKIMKEIRQLEEELGIDERRV